MREVPEDEAEPIYETERAYLARLGVLTPIEKEIFAKFGDTVSGVCCWRYVWRVWWVLD